MAESIARQIKDKLERHPYRILLGLYALCMAAYLVTIPLPRVDRLLIGSDGIYYYAYLPTLLLDHDLNFENQYARLLPSQTVNAMRRTITGRLPNDYAVGSAILWAPWFLAAHALVLPLRAGGAPIAPDGVNYLYQASAMLGSITYGFAGLWVIFHMCRRLFGAAYAIATVVALWFLTNVVYYMIIEPSMSHMCSLFATALFIGLWLRFRPLSSIWQWVILGAAGGLIMLVRLPDATFLALPVLDQLFAKRAWLADIPQWLASSATFALAAIVVFSPQMIVWQVLNGSPFQSGYLVTTQPTFFWLQPKILAVLFSLQHGLYTWHPITLLAALGWVWLGKTDARLALWSAIGFALQVYVIGAWRDWSQGDAFGGRMFISSLPILALGLAAFINRFSSDRAERALWIGAVVLFAWNAIFLVQYRLRYIPMSGPITLEQMTVGKFNMIIDLAQRLVSLFGY